MPILNELAPDFSLPDQSGQLHSLADFTGQWLVLFFYPKDFTPGCTTEVCSLRDGRDEIAEKTGAAIIGISRDDAASHQSFIAEHKLNFTLLSDADAVTVRAYDAEGPTIYDGKNEVLRKTYLIDPSGVVRKIYDAVTPDGHAAQILTDLQSIS